MMLNYFLAEGVGFEPTVPLQTEQRFSRPPPSTARPSLLDGNPISGQVDYFSLPALNCQDGEKA